MNTDYNQPIKFRARFMDCLQQPGMHVDLVEALYDQQELDLQVCLTTNSFFQEKNFIPRYMDQDITKLINDRSWRFTPCPSEALLDQGMDGIFEQMIQQIYHKQKATYIESMSGVFKEIDVPFSYDEVLERIGLLDLAIEEKLAEAPAPKRARHAYSEADIALSTNFLDRWKSHLNKPDHPVDLPIKVAYVQEELDLYVCSAVNSQLQQSNLDPRFTLTEITKLINDGGWRFKSRPIEKRTQEEVLEQGREKIFEQIIEQVYHKQKTRFIKILSQTLEQLGVSLTQDKVRSRIEVLDSNIDLLREIT